MEAWEFVARERIRDLVMRYAQLVDRGRLDEVVLLFAEDATLEAGDLPAAHGRAAIRAVFANVGARLGETSGAYIRHHVSSLTIEVESPAAATAASYFLAVGPRGPDHWGRYRDRLVCVGEQWLLRERRVRVDGRVPDSMFGRSS